MPTLEETYVNRFVVQVISMKRWRTYRVLATRADLQALAHEVATALAKPELEVREDESGATYSPVWRASATEAYGRTDRTQIEIAISEELAPYHERTRKIKLKDRSSLLLLVALIVVFLVGALTLGYFSLVGLDWLLFSRHRA